MSSTEEGGSRSEDTRRKGSADKMNFKDLPKFIADADLNQDLVRGVLRNDGRIDFLNANEGGIRGLPDRQVLELAAATGRVLASHDRHTMTAEFKRFLEEGHSSPGLIIVKQEMDDGDAIEELLLICGASSPDELRDQIFWIPM
jgi:hypothetical protein